MRCGACLNVFQARDHFVDSLYGDEDVVDVSRAPKLEGTLSEEFLALEARERALNDPAMEGRYDETELNEEQRALRERTTAEYRRTPVLAIDKTEQSEGEAEAPRVDDNVDPAKIPDLGSYGFQSGTIEQPASSRRAWIYAGASSVLLLLFVIQLLYSQASGLSNDSRMRPFYQGFCSVFGCTLADVHEPELIRSRQVVVQSHPRARDAIMVDAVIYNDAPYPQAFPWIELQFSDMNGRPVASRRFAPREYLSGDLEGETEMPSKTPIRVSLSLVDPGRDAVNYIMLFH